MKYTLADIARIIDATGTVAGDGIIEHLLLDSRKLYDPAHSLFFALSGPRRDGHQFIAELYQKGLRAFVVGRQQDPSLYPEAVFLEVYDPLAALQQLVAYHRSRFDIPVIGITGSNGKTIVKEWLFQLLHSRYSIIRNPKSYNSQIGVPLSVWPMDEGHQLGIFEAGISEQGEMLRLERIIRPTIGILTNIGEAHSEGFIDKDHKFREKLILFRHCRQLIGRAEDFEGRREVLDLISDQIELLTWGPDPGNTFVTEEIREEGGLTRIRLSYQQESLQFTIPFSDKASVENAIHCAALLLCLDIPRTDITESMKLLHPVNMRLELKKGINHTVVINDSYSTDISSLEIALNFLAQQSAGANKTVILSDFLQSAMPDKFLYMDVAEKLVRHQVNRIIGIGERIAMYLPEQLPEGLAANSSFYPHTQAFIREFRFSHFREEAILVKGARVFEFEKIVQLLELKAHQTVLEINLSALAHNFKEYQKLLAPSTRIMAMVKAFAYGSGGAEIAGILQYHKADYLGVAYTDEGVELRKAGITLPIMVMNPDEQSFEHIIEYQLEPELYSFELLYAFDRFLRQEGIQQFPVHIEMETGMNRLGFAVSDTATLAAALKSSPSFRVQSVFSHLAASEEPVQDDFTAQQFSLFQQAADDLLGELGYSFLRHIANSAAAVRHQQMQLDMVRVGIGLYGVDSAASGKLALHTVATLKSSIAQLKQLKAGESVSYNRRALLDQPATVATIRLGYADGFPRRLGNGLGKVWIRGQLAPVIGTVCMDMFMVDVTAIPDLKVGEEVIIFGKDCPVEQLAKAAGTIPYEIMTGISQRVKRVYFEE